MSRPELDNLVRVRQLKAEPGTQAEFDGLLHSGAARLKDACNRMLSPESRFDLAYNAAHALLPHTLALPATQWRVLDQAHRKRNLAEYEGDVEIDDALLGALIRVATDVETAVRRLDPVEAPRP